MEATRRTTPDGLLTLLITRDSDGDLAAGFEGYSWHVHASSLGEITGLPADEALAAFVSDLLGNRRLIALSHRRGELRDAWVSDDPARDAGFSDADETVSFRYWNGCSWNSS